MGLGYSSHFLDYIKKISRKRLYVVKKEEKKEGIYIMKKVSEFTRQERRDFAKKGLKIVRRDGVCGASIKPLQAVVMGEIPQGYVEGIIHLDPDDLTAIQPYTVRAGRIYEACRLEILRRMQEPSYGEGQGMPAYATIIWDRHHQEDYRATALAQWQADPTDQSAYLFAISCLPLESWHWRMNLWTNDHEVVVIDHLLPRLARRSAGRKGFEALEQGICYASREGKRQAEQMAKRRAFLPDFRHDEVHESEGYVIRDGKKMHFTTEEFVEAWVLWKNHPEPQWETVASYGYDWTSSPSYQAYQNRIPTHAELERSRLWHDASRWER